MRLPWQKLMDCRVSSFVAASGSSNSGGRRTSGAARGPFRQEQVRVRLSPTFNRRAHPDAALEASVDAVWRAYKEQSPRLFNATKFRLHSWHIEAASASSAAAATDASTQLDTGSSGTLVLDWGLTDYKTYLGSCCSTHASRFVADSKILYASGANGGDEFAYLSRKVGVAAIVETSDGKIALIKRSKSVGVYQDMFDTPGGHPEPSHVGLTTESLAALHSDGSDQQSKTETETERAVVREFFASIVNEVHEEINVHERELSAPPLLLGVVLQAEASTPSFAFHLRTARSSVEVMALYRAGPADKFESSSLELIDAELLMQNEAIIDRLTPSARGSLQLWREHVTHQAVAATL